MASASVSLRNYLGCLSALGGDWAGPNAALLASSAGGLEAQALFHVLLTVPALFVMLTVYAGVPAVIGHLAGIRLERVGLGMGPTLVSYNNGVLDLVLGSLPFWATAKFYGEEGLFGIRQDQWPAHRRPSDDDDDDFLDDEDEEDDEPVEPPPPDSFVAAHPLLRTGVSLSGPLALLLFGTALIALGQVFSDNRLVLVPRSDLPVAIRQDPAARPWSESPLFGDYLAVPSTLLTQADSQAESAAVAANPAAPAEPLGDAQTGSVNAAPLQLLATADSVVRFFAMTASSEGYSGYLGWPILLVSALEWGLGFWLSLFGLFMAAIAFLTLMPVPFLRGGMALISLIEWTTGRRPSPQLLTPLSYLGGFWMMLVIWRLMVADMSRFGWI